MLVWECIHRICVLIDFLLEFLSPAAVSACPPMRLCASLCAVYCSCATQFPLFSELPGSPGLGKQRSGHLCMASCLSRIVKTGTRPLGMGSHTATQCIDLLAFHNLRSSVRSLSFLGVKNAHVDRAVQGGPLVRLAANQDDQRDLEFSSEWECVMSR